MDPIGIYPKLDDLKLQKKITLKKEYASYKYDAKIGDIKERTNTICKRSNIFELSPHQEFVKRFISFDTPYNGLLLFHGLGSGKTCSAIGITETLRTFYVNQPHHKKILIVASPKLQSNFFIQLFDKEKLVKENGIWNLSGCVGSQLLSELNISSVEMKQLSHKELCTMIEKIIKDHYSFMGYSKFANHIYTLINSKDGKRKLRDEFEGRVVVIDEFHNIRAEDIGGAEIKKKTASLLNALVEIVKGMKLIFLTGTPMYNNSREIIFLLNILNKNDGRPPIQKKEIREMFDDENNLTETGKETLIKYSNGYISFVRGENPYAFPFMVTPKMFNHPNSYQLLENKPSEQFNGNPIEVPIRYIDILMNDASENQERAYKKIMSDIKDKFKDRNFNEIETLGYNELIKPIQTLLITYPSYDGSFLVGDEGLTYAMDYKSSSVNQEFKYRPGPLDGMFSYDKIGNYSSKIKSILDTIKRSTGIVLIYSQFVYGGIIPLALALEEIGFKRNETGKGKSLFKEKRKDINVFNLDGKSTTKKNSSAKYAIISGDSQISPDNDAEIRTLTSRNNKDGELIKVVLITEAGTEGIDMKNLRQVHVMEPWYNLNRLEQVIGRARRNCSHVDLPMDERNFELYLYSTRLSDPNVETVDTMLYRIAENKSIQMGQVSRVLKSVAVDCLLNIKQQKYSELKDIIKIKLSDRTVIDYSVKDEPFSSLCDYMETCNYSCVNVLGESNIIDKSTYGYKNTKNNKIIDKVKQLFTKRHVYHYKELISLLKNSTTSGDEIERMLFDIIDLKIPINDKFDKTGVISRIGSLYLFQPNELTDPQLSIQDRIVPITLKPKDFLVGKMLETNNEEKDENPEKEKKEIFAETTVNVHFEELKRLYEKSNNDNTNRDWYSLYPLAKKYMMKMHVSEKMLDTFLISHLCDELMLSQELSIINYLFAKDNLTEFEQKIYDHYSKVVFEKDDKKYIGLVGITNKTDDLILYVLHPEYIGISKEIWVKATMSERDEVKFPYKKPLVSSKSLMVGIMGFFKTDFQFKIVDLNNTKRTSTGALVENKQKKELIELLNTILGDNYYKEKSNDTKEEKIIDSKPFLVLLCELYLRYNNERKETKMFLNKTEYYLWRR